MRLTRGYFGEVILARVTLLAPCVLCILLSVAEIGVLKTSVRYEKDLRQSYSRNSTGVKYHVFYEVLAFVLEMLQGLNRRVFRILFSEEVHRVLLQETFKSEIRKTTRRGPGKNTDIYSVRSEAIINCYTYGIFCVSRYLLQFGILFCGTLFSGAKNFSANRVAYYIFLGCFYIAVLFLAAKIRGIWRPRRSDAHAAVIACLVNIFQNICVVRIFRMEDSAIGWFNAAILPLLRADFIHHSYSELGRWIMRLLYITTRILVVVHGYERAGIFAGMNVPATLGLFRRLHVKVLDLRNGLFFFIEYWKEMKYGRIGIETETKQVSGLHASTALDAAKDVTRSVVPDGSPNSPSTPLIIARELVLVDADDRADDECAARSGGGPTLDTEAAGVLSTAAVYDGFDGANTAVAPATVSPMKEKEMADLVVFRNRINLVMAASKHLSASLLSVLLKTAHYNGSLTFDSVELHDICQDDYFRQISYMSKEQSMFRKSVLFNIQYGTGLDPKDAVAASCSLGFGSFISQFQNCFNTDATALSSGQRQVVSLIRCLLRSVPVYILDDPTAFLAQETKQLVYKAISSRQDRTVVIFSNDKSIIPLADHIVQL